MTGSRVAKIVGWVFVGIAVAAAMGLAFGLAVMLLWNWLLPELFGLPMIGYWQAVGLFVLCHLLFKGHIPHKTPDKPHSPPWNRKGKKTCGPFADKIHALVHEKELSEKSPQEPPAQNPA